jgi:transposase
MPAPHPIELREIAVRAYESAGESFSVVASRFGIARRALQRWVKQQRETESVAPRPRGGGNPSPVDVTILAAIVVELGDATTYELTAAYNRRVGRARRVHRSSVQRALRRAGYVFKKNAYVRSNKHAPTSSRNEPSSFGA